MQANIKKKRFSITEQARRTQIVAAAMQTIAEQGYAQASFAQIAKQADLSSTGLISYHFANKKDLDWAVVQEVYQRLSAHMTKALANVSTPQAALVVYIEGLIGFMKHDPFALRAMLGIVMHGGFDYDASSEREAVAGIRDILRWGQAEGVFRDFDIHVMASTIQRSLDGIPLAQSAGPALDLDRYAQELVEIFTRATQKQGLAEQTL